MSKEGQEGLKKLIGDWQKFPVVTAKDLGISPPPVVGDLRELQENVARWLFDNKDRLPNQRFYHSWYDETAASPLTEKEYLNLANEVLAIIKEAGYVSLEEGDKLICKTAWEIINPMITKGIEVDEKESGWRGSLK